MNVNYINSFAEQNMIFRSSVDVVETVSNEPFHCVSVYVPSNLAPSVIVDYGDIAGMITKTKPLVFSCDVQNYAEVMQGNLLTQLQPIFRGDSNIDVVIYIIVFWEEGDVDDWEWGATSVIHKPLQEAFDKLYFISYLKMLYDENMNGEDTLDVPSLGQRGSVSFTLKNESVTERVEGVLNVTISNPTSSPITVAAGDYEGKALDNTEIVLKILSNVEIPANGSNSGAIFAYTVAGSTLPLGASAIGAMDISDDSWTYTELTVNATIHSVGQVAGDPKPIKTNAGEYTFEADGIEYKFKLTSLDEDVIPSGSSSRTIVAKAVNAGNFPLSLPGISSVNWKDITDAGGAQKFLTPASQGNAIEIIVTPTGTDFSAGTPAGQSYDVESKYFDLSLALANACKNNISLSMFWSLVRVKVGDEGNFPNIPPVEDPLNPDGLKDLIATDPNKCKIRSARVEQEINGDLGGIVSLKDATKEKRAKFYWGALKLMQANNTFLVVTSESPNAGSPVTNILSEVLAEWFRLKNQSGLYVGNKVHSIRLSGNNIKPFGWTSMLNTMVNQNDTGWGFNESQTQLVKSGAANVFNAKGVAYLQTISDNSLEDCRLTRARTLSGISINALWIAKWVDYRSAMDCANMITDRGTLTNPVLTDQAAYAKIQSIVATNLEKFTRTGRVVGITLTFPSFATAKVGLTALEAASAWSALYVDDLDKVTISGGITEL